MKIDRRTEEDITAKIDELSESYTPEWHFEKDDPDIGSVIARLFAMQMYENVGLMNNMIDRYHTEFINMLDLSLRPATPAGSLVRFGLIENTVPGTRIRKGTRLQSAASDSEGRQIMFETDRELYVTNSRITDIFMTDREDGTVIPLLGRFKPAEILERSQLLDEDGNPVGGDEQPVLTDPYNTEGALVRPFVLFSEKGNIAKSVLILYHETLFDVTDEPVFIRLSGNKELNDRILSGEFRFKYFAKEGFKEFDSVELTGDGETFELKRKGENFKISDGAKSYSVVILEGSKPVTEAMELTGIGISSTGKARSAEFVTDGANDLNTDSFDPFTDTLSVYNECYIGQNEYFSKAGSTVSLSFHVTYEDHALYLTKQEEEVELKIVKRKPKLLPSDEPARAFVDEISLEYFNGLGWKKLQCGRDISRIFTQDTAHDISITFICPSDWEVSEVGADMGRCLRLRLTRSDNCYLRPALHHYPRISELKVAYSYEGRFVLPSKLFSINGTAKREINMPALSRDSFTVLTGSGYTDDALYLGFDSRIEDGPVSIYFELDDVLNMNELACHFEYSTARGFRQMRIVDQTNSFSRSGAVWFVPPSDMQAKVLEGKKRYWIRIKRGKVKNAEDEAVMFLPRIRKILTNVVGVTNTITLGEVNYYIDSPEPGRRFSLGSGNILDAEVWVNERSSISREEIDSILLTDPDRIDVEYDIFGSPSQVFVRWYETFSFLKVKDRRCYMIDRLTNEIIFSDGIRADIPRVTDDVSFKVRLRITDGEAGNVPAGSITATAGTELFVDSVTNPVRAYGGSNMETIPQALKRGANILYGRNRLVTVSDYIYTILNYSVSIDKAACIPGETIEGDALSSDVSFVLLMKDFSEGSFSFHRISGPLKKHLLDLSSISIMPERIHIVEPIFVDISVTVWVEINSMDESFEVQNMIRDMLNDYLNPISTDKDDGWDIGEIPKRTQILMKLGTLKNHAIVKKTTIIANYSDRNGEHEMDLADLTVSPFMVARSGKHQVQVIYK